MAVQQFIGTRKGKQRDALLSSEKRLPLKPSGIRDNKLSAVDQSYAFQITNRINEMQIRNIPDRGSLLDKTPNPWMHRIDDCGFKLPNCRQQLLQLRFRCVLLTMARQVDVRLPQRKA